MPECISSTIFKSVGLFLKELDVRFVFLFLFFSSVLLSADEVCKRAGSVVIECYHKREKGDLKSCKVEIFKSDMLNKACRLGCLSESLYEANLNAEIIIKECVEGISDVSM